MVRKVEDIFKKYGKKLEQDVRTEKIHVGQVSREYLQFKKDMLPELSKYEKLCKSLGNIIKLKIAEKDRAKGRPIT